MTTNTMTTTNERNPQFELLNTKNVCMYKNSTKQRTIVLFLNKNTQKKTTPTNTTKTTYTEATITNFKSTI